jgi:mRNA-binding protein PUF3
VERAEFKQKIIVQYDLLKATGRTLEKLDRIFEEDRQMESRETKLPSNLQIEVDSAGPTPVLTNETNSPQSDSLPSADASTIEYPRINKKTMGANPRVRDDDDA